MDTCLKYIQILPQKQIVISFLYGDEESGLERNCFWNCFNYHYWLLQKHWNRNRNIVFDENDFDYDLENLKLGD